MLILVAHERQPTKDLLPITNLGATGHMMPLHLVWLVDFLVRQWHPRLQHHPRRDFQLGEAKRLLKHQEEGWVRPRQHPLQRLQQLGVGMMVPGTKKARRLRRGKTIGHGFGDCCIATEPASRCIFHISERCFVGVLDGKTTGVVTGAPSDAALDPV